ncbi:MAG: hypothetical protein J6S91_09475, partial [Treponema sp.]|nr:hypothetical protein [Treponema sp.]
SCSNGTTSITLTLRSDDFSPSLARDIEPDSSIKEAGYYVVASIRGAYNQAQSSFLARNEDEGTFTFDNIPVGRKVYAEVKVYTFEPDFYDDETRYNYFIQEASGRSEEITVSQGENYLNLDICSFSFDQQTYFPLSGPETSDTWAMIELYSNGLYFIRQPDGPAYSEGTWRTEPEFENLFDQSDPYTLYLTECVYGKEKIRKDGAYEDIYTTPVIIELPQEKALEIKGGRNPYFKFTSKSGKSFVFGEEIIDDPQPETYRVNIACPESMGTCEYSGAEFIEAGIQVKFKINPIDGYRVKSVKVTDSYQSTIYFENLTTDSNGYYSFTMPAENVRVGIEFEEDTLPTSFIGTSYTVLPNGTIGTAGQGSNTYVQFGDWPQTEIVAGVTVNESDNVQVADFTYYKGSDNSWYYKHTEDDKYYKVEPIKWRILTNNYNGKKLLLSENVIMGKIYDNDSNNYKESEIRSWLNDNFFNIAFAGTNKDIIAETSVDNTNESTNPASNPNLWTTEYKCDDTDDKVFLLSEKEVTTAEYGFGNYNSTDNTRIRQPTDFAKANDVSEDYNACNWLLRSPGVTDSYSIRTVSYQGDANSSKSCDTAPYGVCPALCVDAD